MKPQTRGEMVRTLNEMRRKRLGYSTNNLDQIRNTASARVLTACIIAINSYQVATRQELLDKVKYWMELALRRQNGAIHRGYSGEAARYQGAASACLAALTLL